MGLHRKKDLSFPHVNTYKRLGTRFELMRKLMVYCHGREGIAPVSRMAGRDPAIPRARSRQWGWGW
jgi:hypothetical protein